MKQHPFIFSDEPRYRIRRHLAFWVFWWLFQSILYSFVALEAPGAYWGRMPMVMTESLIFMAVHISLSYSLLYFVIPRYLLQQRYAQTIFWTMLCCLAAAALSGTLAIYVIRPIRIWMLGPYRMSPARSMGMDFFLSLMAGLRGGITIGGMAAAIKLMKYWYVKEQRNLQLQKENAEAQLQLLKAQVHPHFLFNTLNNIYANTQATAPVASGMLMQLSDILRFILYEGSQPQVALAKELKMVQDYIALEQMRYDEQLDVFIDVPQNTDELTIAPLLLLPLVENCFKHGTSHMLEHPWMSLQVRLEDGLMQLKLVNGKTALPATDQAANGIGISNVRQRLELLYPDKHIFTITNDPDVFIVNLSIQLRTSGTSRKKTGRPLSNQHA
ncbi:MAG: histidine kinase [Candidatus Pseudobacter hemicellulosilyticus]|uniref:Histidine kinase n=1 Tax=Candidatus Pseudobacter hemicellulosilyticus TaxID=3121375 RepID=A0AAJ5WUJ4_9BACT|nr:MAG: histidine kinase [Pseudobacter sp.]